MSSGWDRQNLARLRAILQSLILDEETTRPIDPVRADHLRDAIADTRTLISRLESPFSADAGGRPRAPSGERSQSAHPVQEPSDPPPKWNARAHMSSAVWATKAEFARLQDLGRSLMLAFPLYGVDTPHDRFFARNPPAASND